MSRYLTTSVFLFLCLLGCTSQKETSSNSEFPLPILTVESEKMNNAILNRKPDYGRGGTDGDVILNELKIQLTDIALKEKEAKIEGSILDVKSKEKLHNADIKIVNGQKKFVEGVRADSTGKFKINFTYEEGQQMEINYVAYRTLFIDLSKLFQHKSK